MMNRAISRTIAGGIAGGILPKSIAVTVASRLAPTFHRPTLSCLPTGSKYQSTQATTLKKIIPEFWILKMKTAFVWHDVNGDGYITADDFAGWIREMAKLFPDMTEDQRKTLEAKHGYVWGDLLDGDGKGPDYKVTESMYIEKIFNAVSKDGAEDMMRKEWNNNFTVMDVNKDGVISKAEHRRFFEAKKQLNPSVAIVAFSAIDKDMDGFISRDEYVEAALQFFSNFSDETKPSKHFFGPLVKF